MTTLRVIPLTEEGAEVEGMVGAGGSVILVCGRFVEAGLRSAEQKLR